MLHKLELVRIWTAEQYRATQEWKTAIELDDVGVLLLLLIAVYRSVQRLHYLLLLQRFHVELFASSWAKVAVQEVGTGAVNCLSQSS